MTSSLYYYNDIAIYSIQMIDKKPQYGYTSFRDLVISKIKGMARAETMGEEMRRLRLFSFLSGGLK